MSRKRLPMPGDMPAVLDHFRHAIASPARCPSSLLPPPSSLLPPSCTGGQHAAAGGACLFDFCFVFAFSTGRLRRTRRSVYGCAVARQSSASAAHVQGTETTSYLLCFAVQYELRMKLAPRAPNGTSAARLAVGWLADCNCEGNDIGAAFEAYATRACDIASPP